MILKFSADVDTLKGNELTKPQQLNHPHVNYEKLAAFREYCERLDLLKDEGKQFL